MIEISEILPCCRCHDWFIPTDYQKRGGGKHCPACKSFMDRRHNARSALIKGSKPSLRLFDANGKRLPTVGTKEWFELNTVPMLYCGCLIWMGISKTRPYGTARFNGKEQNVSRIAYQVARGPIGKGLFVLHKCDTPPCINIDHLFLGTPQDNVDDMIAKGRQRSPGRRAAREKEAK